MFLSGSRTFVGFGFGAIRTGLFLYEAFRSGAFRRLVVAGVGPVELLKPNAVGDRGRLSDALAMADEIGTAVPRVKYFTRAELGSLHRILAQGRQHKADRQGPRAVVYTTENHNHAAEILSEQASSEVPSSERGAVCGQVRFLNTVVGKMSGVLSVPAAISQAGFCLIALLARKHGGIAPLFSPAGYAAYADDLLVRMLAPFFKD